MKLYVFVFVLERMLKETVEASSETTILRLRSFVASSNCRLRKHVSRIYERTKFESLKTKVYSLDRKRQWIWQTKKRRRFQRNGNRNQKNSHFSTPNAWDASAFLLPTRWDYSRRIIFGILMETRQLHSIRRFNRKTRAEFGRGELKIIVWVIFFSRRFRSVRRTRAMWDPRLQTDYRIKDSETELIHEFRISVRIQNSELSSASESHIFVLRSWGMIQSQKLWHFVTSSALEVIIRQRRPLDQRNIWICIRVVMNGLLSLNLKTKKILSPTN